MSTIGNCEMWWFQSFGNMHYVVVCNSHTSDSMNSYWAMRYSLTLVTHICLKFGRYSCIVFVACLQYMDGKLPSHEPHLIVLWIMGSLGVFGIMHSTWCDLEIWPCEELMTFGVCPFECLVMWYFSGNLGGGSSCSTVIWISWIHYKAASAGIAQGRSWATC